ncbi:tetratricopeptide repeat protein [Nostoc sp. FACHB-973]|nr:tetratricopeptide repeat protein [Nostoc sp. FACHB-973]
MTNNFHPKDKLSKDFFDRLQILLNLHSTFAGKSYEYTDNIPLIISRLNNSIEQGQLIDVFSTIEEIIYETQSSNAIDGKPFLDYFNDFSTKVYAYSEINELKYIFPKQQELSLYELRANNKLILKDYLGVIQDIEYAINLSTKSEPSLNTIYSFYKIAAQAHHKLGNFQKAIDYYTKAIEMNFDNTFIYDFRMQVYIDAGNYHEAIQDCISVINLGFRTPSKYELLGDIYLKSGNKQEAIDTYKKSITICEQEIEKINAKGRDPFNSLEIYTESQKKLLLKIKSLETNSVVNNQIITSQASASGDCFILTATFGRPYAKEVIKYRNFRDQYLCNYLLGRGFIYLYNYWGPGLAIIVNKNPRLKCFMAKTLGAVSQVLPEVKDYKFKNMCK